MKSVCAWCKTVLRGDSQDDAHPVTHGICVRCAQEFFSSGVGESLRGFLDQLGVPVLVVDDDRVVQTANSQAGQLLGKDVDEIENRLPGQVIECIHASKPGGCGRQVRCQSCIIRQLVLETHATGKAFTRVPAFPDLQTDDGIRTTRVEISTEKVGNIVLLRLHEIRKVDASTAKPHAPVAEIR